MCKYLGWSLLLFVSFATVYFSQRSEKQKLFPFDSKDKCGYINQQGEIVVTPQFDMCRRFDEGMAGVSLSKKYGFIDETGQLVIPLKFDGFFPESFSEGLAPVKIRNEIGNLDLGYVDKYGDIKYVPKVSEIDSFYEGLAKVKKDGKWGFIDKNMNFVIPPKYDFARSFADGLAWVGNSIDKDYYIDKTGRKVIDKYGTDGSDFSEGVAAFRNKYLGYGFMNISGKIVIKPRFIFSCLYKEGLACVEVDGKWGYIDKDERFAIPPQFDEADNFSTDGIAVVKVDGKYGFINKKGEFIISPQFEKAEWLDGLGKVEIGGTKKYINRMNQVVWQSEEKD